MDAIKEVAQVERCDDQAVPFTDHVPGCFGRNSPETALFVLGQCAALGSNITTWFYSRCRMKGAPYRLDPSKIGVPSGQSTVFIVPKAVGNFMIFYPQNQPLPTTPLCFGFPSRGHVKKINVYLHPGHGVEGSWQVRSFEEPASASL
ncbi:dehydrogenase [Anopheles sinensis]|uniref:Dehydrogenase n=1 Tax=Anopheles sinensis TaxID=74873 RepID=A0A084W1S3_ANOSI|nr:dehydrogenase [Anopheles sinensis]